MSLRLVKGLQLTMLWETRAFPVEEFPIEAHFKIPADDELTREVTFTVPPQLAGERFRRGVRPAPRRIYELV